MPSSRPLTIPPPLSPDLVVARLRSAGCVFAEDEARLIVAEARTPDDLAAMVERRAGGVPLEHVLGWAEFCGLRIGVDLGVFVPRRRTELLVRQASRLLRPGAVVVDLCCGSGAVGAALARRSPGGATRPGGVEPHSVDLHSVDLHCVDLHAVDVDPDAVRCASRNLAGVGAVYQGDLYAPLPGSLRGRVDVLVANAPYVPTSAIELMPPEARDHEPRVALDGGADGLAVQRRVAAQAVDWLAPEGHLLVETSERQAPRTVATFVAHGLEARVARSRPLGATVVVGSRPPP